MANRTGYTACRYLLLQCCDHIRALGVNHDRNAGFLRGLQRFEDCIVIAVIWLSSVSHEQFQGCYAILRHMLDFFEQSIIRIIYNTVIAIVTACISIDLVLLIFIDGSLQRRAYLLVYKVYDRCRS